MATQWRILRTILVLLLGAAALAASVFTLAVIAPPRLWADLNSPISRVYLIALPAFAVLVAGITVLCLRRVLVRALPLAVAASLPAVAVLAAGFSAAVYVDWRIFIANQQSKLFRALLNGAVLESGNPLSPANAGHRFIAKARTVSMTLRHFVGS